MDDITQFSAAALAERLAGGDLSSEEVTRAFLERVAATDETVHAFVHVDAEAAMATARDIDQRRAAGEQLHQLAGVPIAIKDIVATTRMPTTCGSRMLQDWVSPYDATIVERIKACDMPIVGKTNLDEFAMGSSTERSFFGPTRNPWDTDRVPGGSGGGSAAAIAAHQAPLAIGTDTGGSIRQPSALTGTVGVKPTYGTVSRYGIVSMASSLEHAGPVAQSVADAALLHEVIAGHDSRDSTSSDVASPAVREAARTADVTGMRIGLVPELSGAGFAPEVTARFNEAAELLASAGAQVVEVSCPSFVHAVAAYYLVMPSEVSSNLARFDAMRYGLRVSPAGSDAPSAEQVMAASRDAGFGDEVKRRIILGTYALSSGSYDAHYGAAQRVRTLIAADFQAAFGHVDVLMSPTAPTTAFRLGEKVDDPLAMYAQDTATIPANLAGVPAISLPSGLAENNLPAGVQFMAPMMADERLYRAGAVLERLLMERSGGPLLDHVPSMEGAQ